VSASRWLVQQRVALARQLLESTDTPVEQVAAEAGFGTAASLRQHLNAAIGVAPLAYRRTYRGTAPSPDVTGDSPA
jgi:transcriptional regulator GlxA family with amidase domain